MSDDWICTTHSPHEQDELLAALRRAGIPADHVTVSGAPGAARGSAGEEDAGGDFWPIADGALSGCIGGAFGAYVGAFTLLLPGIRPYQDLGPGILILGSAALCAVAGIVISLAIKACFPDHERELREEAGKSAPHIMTIHGDDGRESQLIHEVLVATGHGDSVHASAPGQA
jgi:hypothetical protein